MYIEPELLMELAGTPNAYKRGVEYAKNGYAKLSSPYRGTYYASVRGSEGNFYTVFFKINSHGDDIQAYSCTCPAYDEYGGLCKHIIAAVMTLKAQENKGVKKKAEEPSTDKSALKLIQWYANAIAVNATPTGESILEATLNYETGACLSFKVGESRLYTVQDVYQFSHRFVFMEQYSYGKKYTLFHHPSSFQQTARPIVDFFLDFFDSNNYTLAHRYGPGNNKRYMHLSPYMLDLFISMYSGATLPSNDGTADKSLTVVNEDYRAKLILKKYSERYMLSLKDEITVLKGQTSAYTITEDKLYVCSAGWSDACVPLFDALKSSGGKLRFAAKDLPALYSTILSQAKPYIELLTSEELSEFIPPSLVTKVYLDVPSEGKIEGHMTFSYGDKTHEAFAPKLVTDTYDIVGEVSAERVVMSFFNNSHDTRGYFVLDNDPDALYRLISSGLAEIGEFAEIYASDAVGRIRIQSPPAISVGVRLDADLLQVNFDVEDLNLAELSGILDSYRRAKKYHLLKNGSFLTLEEGALSGLSALAEGLDLNAAQLSSGHAELPLTRSLYLDAMMKKADGIHFDRDTAFKGIIRDMHDIADSNFAVPKELQKTLRDYQKTGYRWLRTIAQYRFGGILADDMGLGKTIQVLSLLKACKDEGGTLPSLVVCPASLLLNWDSETRKFTPELRVKALIGNASERSDVLSDAENYDLLITSYGQLGRDITQYEEKQFAFVILDEAQNIKNHNTQNAKAVKLLKGNTRLALTGTPVENSLAELWSIFDFLMPGYLWNYNKFRKKYEEPIVKQQDTVAEQRLRQLVKPFMLRRLKKDVLNELPPKIETVLHSEMGDEQKKLYIASLAQAKLEVMQSDSAQGKLQILAALTRLRQICCDPALLFENYQSGSVKLDACMELVESCLESGHRILLFSQFTSMLDRIETRLEMQHITWLRIDGSVNPSRRMELVNSFNLGKAQIFLISLKAGGTGLNLTGADVVIHYDPWWNVSAQNQATDRAHRIGQKNSVQVYKLIVKDTLEERILHLQEHKADLADRIVSAEASGLAGMSRDEVMALLEG